MTLVQCGLRDYGTGTWTGGDEACDHKTEPKPERKFTNGRGEGQGDDYAGSNLRSWTTRDATPASGICKCGARRVDDQLGLEATPTLYVERLVSVFREVRRVLRDDGTLWLNLGDSYNANQGAGFDTNQDGDKNGKKAAGASPRMKWGKPKDLVGIPWRVAFALQADGWYLRSDIIWSKPNPMPESVTDRPTKAHEYVFLFSKQPRYFYDADAIREPGEPFRVKQPDGWDTDPGGHGSYHRNGREAGVSTDEIRSGRNRRSVWTIPTEPFPEAHFATYPQELVRPCIVAGTSERGECSACGDPFERVIEKGDLVGKDRGGNYKGRDIDPLVYRNGGTPGMAYERWTQGWATNCSCDNPVPVPQLVLDPFIGSGTTALVARKHGRRCIGIDLSSEYLAIAAKRTSQLSLLGGAA